MGSAPHVLRLDLATGTAADLHVLVAVSPSDDASKALDLELLATDNSKAYVMTLSHSKIARYRTSKTSCSESDWEETLEALLCATKPIGDIEATSRIGDDLEKPTGEDRGFLFIDVRKKVSEHAEDEPKVLGSLKLRRSNKALERVDLFDWCAEAIKARDTLTQDVDHLKREHDALKALVAEETVKVKELARSKREFEATHDSWLKDLLNEKKVKIRTQEQLLATAHVDPNKLAAVVTASKLRRGGEPRPARKGKRKAKASETSDDEADKMDVDVVEAPESHDEEMGEVDRATTQGSEETASEPESDPPTKKVGKKSAQSSPASAVGIPGRAGKAGNAHKIGHNLRDKKVVTPDESENETPAPQKKSPMSRKKSAPTPDVDPDDVSTASE